MVQELSTGDTTKIGNGIHYYYYHTMLPDIPSLPSFLPSVLTLPW